MSGLMLETSLSLLQRLMGCAELNQEELESKTIELLEMIEDHLLVAARVALFDRGIPNPGLETVHDLLKSLARA